MNRQLLGLGGALVIGALILSFSLSAQASIFDDFLNFFRPETSSSTVSLAPEKNLYRPALDYEAAVMAAVEKASPSVVSIVITKDLPVLENCYYSPFGDIPEEFQDFFRQDFQFSRPCDNGRTAKQEVGGGSGFVVSEDGLILTNKHVVYDSKAEYTVLTNDGEKYPAEVLARDPVQDLAILKIKTTGLTAAILGDSDSLKLGQTAIAIGNSLGEFRNTVSVGVISGLSRTITASGRGIGSETIQGVVQTDAAINEGNSGGPLLNLKGEVVGINTAVVSGAQNIGFAIPVNQAKRDIESVKKTGEIKVAYLGVRYLIITPEIAEREKLTVDYGALVRGDKDGPGVLKDSPAEKAGLLAEDVILEVNGEKITAENPLGLVVQKYNVGDAISLKIKRGQEIKELKVTLTDRKEL